MTDKKVLSMKERDTYDLFSDPNLQAMYENLPEEDKRQYKIQGEYMYNKDYENANNDLESRLIESAAYINEGMKSGLRPSQLDKDEVHVMREIFGKEWYKKYNFQSEED